MLTLSIAPLTKAGFAPFGEVVETGDVKPKLINEGFAQRFDDLAEIDVAAEGGEVNISLFTALQGRAPIRHQADGAPSARQPALHPAERESPGWSWYARIPASRRATGRLPRRDNRASTTRETAGIIRCWSLTDASPSSSSTEGPGGNLEERWLEAANWLRSRPMVRRKRTRTSR